jgi:hypothetical protein
MTLADLRKLVADADNQGCPDHTRVSVVIPTAQRRDAAGNLEASAYQWFDPEWCRVEENHRLEEDEKELPLQIVLQLALDTPDRIEEDAAYNDRGHSGNRVVL